MHGRTRRRSEGTLQRRRPVARVAAEAFHVHTSEDLLGVKEVVRPADEPEVVDRRGSPERDGLEVVELKLPAAVAAAAVRADPGAAPAVALPHRAAHYRWDRGGLRPGRLRTLRR